MKIRLLGLLLPLIVCITILGYPAPEKAGAQESTMERLHPMPVATGDAACATEGTYLYVIGGLQQYYTVYLNDCQRYNPASDTWDLMADMPTARWGAAAAYLNGSIYVFGGYSPGTYSKKCEAYNIATNSWSTRTDLPYGCRSMLAITAGDYIYLWYCDLAMGPPCYAYRFDPKGNNGAGSYTQLASSSHSHGYGGASYVNVNGEERIYLLGGGEDPGVSTDHCEYYRIAHNDYVAIDPAPDGRDGQVREQFAYDGKIYYGPGEDMQLGPTWYDSFFVYDTVTASWDPDPVFRCATPKDGVCGGVIGNVLYLFGGRPNGWTELTEAESYAIGEYVEPALPTVSITSPQDGATLCGAVVLSADASAEAGIADVRFLLDGTQIGQPVTSAPYTISWESTVTNDGSHTIGAVASDLSGNKATESIRVYVENGNTGPVTYVQGVSSTKYRTRSISTGFSSALTAGNLVVVSISGSRTPSSVTVSDNLGNTYSVAGAVQQSSAGYFCALYYAENVAGGRATITAGTNTYGNLSITAAEFSGINNKLSLDDASGARGTGFTPSSGDMTPSVSGCLVIGAGTRDRRNITSAGPGFAMVDIATEDIYNRQPLATEYRVVNGASPVSATFSLVDSSNWVQVGAIFRPAGSDVPDTTPPTAPTGLSATAVSASRIDLSWYPSTDDNGVSGYRVYRNGAQIATTTLTVYQDTGLEESTTYTYRVAAFDGAGNTSGLSSWVSATTEDLADTTPPTVPEGLSATAVSASRIDLSWDLSTDDEGVAGYLVYRNGAQIGSTTAIVYSDTGLEESTTYTYRVAAYDGAGNTSGLSSWVSATTEDLADTTPPTVPEGLSATAVSASRIDLSWYPSTDDEGVAGYRVYRDGVQIGASTTTAYSDTGVQESIIYTYTVAAFDGAGNISSRSAPVTATIQALGFSISVSPSSRTVSLGKSTEYTVTLTAPAGYSLPVTLSVSGLPWGTSYEFSDDTVTPSEAGTISTLTISTSYSRWGWWLRGTYTLTITGTDTFSATQSTTVKLVIR